MDKHLSYVLNKLLVAFPLPILFTSQTHFGAFGLFGWLGRFAATGGGGLGGRVGFQARVGCGVVLSGFSIDRSFFFSVFRGLDGLVAVVGLR